MSYASGDTNICAVDAGTGALMLLTAGDCVITVTASATPNYQAATATFTITLSAAPTLTVTLEAAIAGDNVVNIAEQTTGFAITGTVDAGATVEVTLGSGTTRRATVTDTAWTVDIPANDPEITGASIEVVATAMRADSNDGEARRTIDVDLAAPTATYTPPAALTVGTAITTITPTSPSADITTYAVQSGTLPPGLTLTGDTGVISGAPTTANAATAEVTIRLTDTNDNPGDVLIDFPAVERGQSDADRLCLRLLHGNGPPAQPPDADCSHGAPLPAVP